MNKKIIKSIAVTFLYFIDFLLLYASIKISYFIRFSPNFSITQWEVYYKYIMWYVIILFLLLNIYKINNLEYFIISSKKEKFLNSLKVVFYFLSSIFFISYFMKFTVISRIYYLILFVILLNFYLVKNYFLFYFIKYLYRLEIIQSNYVIVGMGKNGKSIYDKLLYHNSVKGYIDDVKREDGFLGTIDDLKSKLINYLKKNNISIIIALPLKRQNLILDIISVCLKNNIRVFVLPDLLEKSKTKFIDIYHIESIPLLKII